jgi:hypothetical protein
VFIIRPIQIVDSQLTSSNVAETDYTAYNSGTTYTAAQRCMVTTNVHRIYESLAGGNFNHDPVVDLAAPPDPTKPNIGTYWKRISATNRWKSFDNLMGSQVSQATSITYKITPGEIFDSIFFGNLDAVTVQITMTDPSEGIVYDKTIDLLSTVITGIGGVYDWYSYFFSSFIKITDFVKLDVPPYLNAVTDITITYTGGTAKVGEIVPGLLTNIGTTLFSPQIGTTDYSVIAPDDYGIYTINKRTYSKNLNCDVRVLNVALDQVVNLLNLYLGTPIVVIAEENHSSLMTYGIIKDHSLTYTCELYSDLNIDIQGLT